MINNHIDTFASLPVFEFDPAAPPPDDPGAVAIRLSTEFEENERFQAKWDAFFVAEWADQVRALVIGERGEAYKSSVPVESLVERAAACPRCGHSSSPS